MEVLILPFFVGCLVVAVTIAAFVFTVREGTLDHSDRLALLPLRDDAPPKASQAPTDAEKGPSK